MQIEFNDDLPLIFNFPNYRVPEWEQQYNLTWYLDHKHYTGKEKIWVWRVLSTTLTTGDKDMGYVSPACGNKLDVVFISYYEENAEANWQRLLEKVPNALRVDGVEGILEAHKAAASLSTTDMFYVVDGDAYILDDFEFNFVPNIFDRTAVYVFQSTNPINGLIYGYGGVKILPTEQTLMTYSANTDITTSISDKFIIVEKLSNITAFNTDAFNTWRSAFRECAKLAAGNIVRSNHQENIKRLQVWQTTGHQEPYGVDAIDGAKHGSRYGEKFANDSEKLSMINDKDWLRKVYDTYRFRLV